MQDPHHHPIFLLNISMNVQGLIECKTHSNLWGLGNKLFRMKIIINQKF
jgi:hypothetical protein